MTDVVSRVVLERHEIGQLYLVASCSFATLRLHRWVCNRLNYTIDVMTCFLYARVAKLCGSRNGADNNGCKHHPISKRRIGLLRGQYSVASQSDLPIASFTTPVANGR